MKRFDELSDRGQLRRLRRCSREALRKYGISDPELTLLAHHRQTTFRVDSPRTGHKYVLRCHLAGDRDPQHVRSEFHWLRSLRQNTEIVVPEPVATLDGEDVPQVAAAGLPQDLHCSMTRWVEGRRYFRRRGPGARVLREVGRIMATMHCQTESFVPPEGFRCPVWNRERLFDATARRAATAEKRVLDTNGRRLFRQTEQRAGRTMELLGTGREVFGAIHGDLIQANYVVHHKQVRVIDFADFGFGHFLYDIGITLHALWGLDEDQKQRRAFLAGYREVRQLPPEHEDVLDLLIAARAVVQARFVMTSTHPGDQRIALRYIEKVIDGLKHWLG